MVFLPKKVAIFLIFFFLIFFSGILSAYWLIFKGGSVGFLNFHPEIKWRVDEERFSPARNEFSRMSRGRLFILYVSPYVRISKDVIGVGDNPNPIYYFEWNKFAGIDILRISVTEDWSTRDQLYRDRALTLSLNKSLAEKYEGGRDVENTLNNLLAREDPPALGLRER